MNEDFDSGQSIKEEQGIRLQRFSMAALTYALVIMATAFITRMDLGELGLELWIVYLGAAILINLAFFLLFHTGENLRFSEPSLTREQIIVSGMWGMIALYGLPEARPVVLMLYLPAFSFGMFRLKRGEYFEVAGVVMVLYGMLLLTEYLTGRTGFNPSYELFLYGIYSILLFWFAFFGGIISDIRHQLRNRNQKIRKAHEIIEKEMEERKRAAAEQDRLIDELSDALERIETLRGLLPICASCKKIRDDKGYWKQIETYISEHSRAEFSHSICPECARKLYPDHLKDGKDIE